MICYQDRAFCISPKCENKCGRKLTDAVRTAAQKAKLPISTAYFCDNSGGVLRTKLLPPLIGPGD